MLIKTFPVSKKRKEKERTEELGKKRREEREGEREKRRERKIRQDMKRKKREEEGGGKMRRGKSNNQLAMFIRSFVTVFPEMRVSMCFSNLRLPCYMAWVENQLVLPNQIFKSERIDYFFD